MQHARAMTGDTSNRDVVAVLARLLLEAASPHAGKEVADERA